RTAHNGIDLYTWGEQECVLPIGATGADLHDAGLNLHPGDLLLLEETRGADDPDQPADPARRQVVRLTSVRAVHDPVTGTDVLTVGWDPADALTVPIRVSARIPAETGPLVAIGVARGNAVACD